MILISNKVKVFKRNSFFTKIVLKLSNHLKLAQNGPTQPNRTKTKTGQKRPKLLKNDFCKLKAKKMFCNKNFLQSFPETLQITLFCKETSNTAKQHKNQNRFKGRKH